jgi:DNA polymerase II small subunit
VTKNGNILATIEDETGVARIIFNKIDRDTRPEVVSLFKEGQKLVKDEVIGVKGKLSGDFVIASALYRPDIPIHTRKATENDVAIAFMSDVHVGSKLFMEKQFSKFLEWMNGNVDYKRQLAEKVKYLVISGDLVDGIGVYPNQEKELSIPNIYQQYEVFFDLLSKIPDYVHIFILTGNHDAVQRAEPQPVLHDAFVKNMKSNNMHLVSNPGYMSIEGLKVLGYHGTSLDSMIQGIAGCSYSRPEGVMVETLKRRHLCPIYGDNPIIPSARDNMVMDIVPDILHMGHLHKNGYAEYHGTMVVNSGTWQGRTSYQVKLGHMPTPAVLPVYETKTMNLSEVDFNTLVT